MNQSSKFQWMIACAVSCSLSVSVWAQELTPSKPYEYLQQGELLVAQSSSPEGIRVAREIYAMGVLVAARQGEHLLASSCCIAIASTYQQNDSEYETLWDLALLLSPERESQWLTHRGGSSKLNDAQRAAEAIRLLRNAEYAQASKLLKDNHVRAEINRASERLGLQRATVWQHINRMTAAASNDPCNGKYFQVEIVDGKAHRRVCTQHPWAIGAAPDLDQLKLLIGIEALCADAADEMDDWGGVYELSITQPVSLPSLDWLRDLYKLDPSRPVLKDDRWVSAP